MEKYFEGSKKRNGKDVFRAFFFSFKSQLIPIFALTFGSETVLNQQLHWVTADFLQESRHGEGQQQLEAAVFIFCVSGSGWERRTRAHTHTSAQSVGASEDPALLDLSER